MARKDRVMGEGECPAWTSNEVSRGRGLRTPAAVLAQQSIGHGFASEWWSAGLWCAVEAVLAESWLSEDSWTMPAAEAVATIVIASPVASPVGSGNARSRSFSGCRSPHIGSGAGGWGRSTLGSSTTSPELQCPAWPAQQAIASCPAEAAALSGPKDAKNDVARKMATSARATIFAIETPRVLFRLMRTFRK
ncbi:MAG TPA: hypothetical protein VGN90_08490 [Pyrinomonadaceae bacterium]|nr:hypothetical protein [Pyrinomonadaceae bacterium]